MSTVLIKPRQNGANIDRCTQQQRMFVLYMMADETWCPTEAARKAGAKHPHVQATRWMKLPHVRAILGKFQREREERTQMTSDDIWAYLHRVLTFDPATVYSRSGGTWWLIDDLDKMPLEHRQLIEEIGAKNIKINDKEVVVPVVKFVSKSKALDIAARHAIPQKHEHAVVQVPWDELVASSNGQVPDMIEAEIVGVKHKGNGQGNGQ